MLEAPLNENERTSWFYVIVWSLFIFMTVPLARGIQAYVSEHWGRDMFMHGVIICVIIMLCIAILKLRQKIEIDPAHPRVIMTVHGVGYKLLDGGR